MGQAHALVGDIISFEVEENAGISSISGILSFN